MPGAAQPPLTLPRLSTKSHNSALDELVFTSKLGFRKIHYLKRVNQENEWREVELDGVRGVAYGAPYPFANALFVGID